MNNPIGSTLLFCLMAAAWPNSSSILGEDVTPGDFHEYTHESGDVPKNVYQYSIFVPKDYDTKKSYPLVFYLHGGGRGRSHPNQGKRNMVSATLRDNNRKTDAGFSKNMQDFLDIFSCLRSSRWLRGMRPSSVGL